MRFLKTVLLAGVASAMFLGACPLANAGLIPVTEDDGVGTLTLKGTTGGLDVTFGADTNINVINSVSILPTLPVSMPTFHLVGTPSLMTGTGTKIITDGGDTVTMTLVLTATIVAFGPGPNPPQFILISGTVTGVTENHPGLGTYDWMPINGASFFAGNTSANGGLSGLVGHPALPAKTAAGSFNQTGVVPEPSSVVLMGLGVVGLAGGARFRRNRSC